jgi:hypothetical protein
MRVSSPTVNSGLPGSSRISAECQNRSWADGHCATWATDAGARFVAFFGQRLMT